MNKLHMPAQTEKSDEPEITQEESVPSDGKDAEGEKLMKEVRNPRLDQSNEGRKP